MNIFCTLNKINGKIYVGKELGNREKYLGSGKIFKKAIKKYGKENFTKVILEECTSEKRLNKREKYWIKILNARNNSIGYNIAEGGTGGPTNSGKKFNKSWRNKIAKSKLGDKNPTKNIDVRKKISESHKGKIIGRDHKINISKGLSKFYKKNSNWAKGLSKLTDGRVKKISDSIKKNGKVLGQNNGMAKKYLVQFLDNEPFVINCLSEFKIKNSLPSGSMMMKAIKYNKIYKGWKIKNYEGV